jgi:hypothetical protein
MTQRLQIILLIGTILNTILVIRLIRKGTLQLKYSLIWIITASLLILLASFPIILDKLSIILGIFTPTNLLFLLNLFFQLIVLLSLTIALSKCSVRIKILTQEVALLQHKLENNQKVKID